VLVKLGSRWVPLWASCHILVAFSRSPLNQQLHVRLIELPRDYPFLGSHSFPTSISSIELDEVPTDDEVPIDDEAAAGVEDARCLSPRVLLAERNSHPAINLIKRIHRVTPD